MYKVVFIKIEKSRNVNMYCYMNKTRKTLLILLNNICFFLFIFNKI